MDVTLTVQNTPNPNAFKFVLNRAVKTEGKATYVESGECGDNELAKGIFGVDSSIKEVYFFDNYITVTLDGQEDWASLESKIRAVILEKISEHNSDFVVEAAKVEALTVLGGDVELTQIDAILNETIRPALQMDGGDVQAVSYADNVLKILYHGACGSCPSATFGTLRAIENILKDRFNPEITVELDDSL